jgi:hypothetical protein
MRMFILRHVQASSSKRGSSTILTYFRTTPSSILTTYFLKSTTPRPQPSPPPIPVRHLPTTTMSTTESSTYTPDIPSEPVTKTTDTIHIELTPNDLDSPAAARFVRSPSAGATVLFIGTTRDSFNDKAVSSLSYTSYAPLAMATLFKIANSMSSHPHPSPFSLHQTLSFV